MANFSYGKSVHYRALPIASVVRTQDRHSLWRRTTNHLSTAWHYQAGRWERRLPVNESQPCSLSWRFSTYCRGTGEAIDARAHIRRYERGDPEVCTPSRAGDPPRGGYEDQVPCHRVSCRRKRKFFTAALFRIEVDWSGLDQA